MIPLIIAVAIYILIWLYIIFLPPIVITVNRIGKTSALGMAFFMFIFIIKDLEKTYREKVLKHEFEHYKQEAIYSPLLFYIIYFFLCLKTIIKEKRLNIYNRKNHFLETAAMKAMNSDKPLRNYLSFTRNPRK